MSDYKPIEEFRNRIILGNCLDVLKGMESNSVTAVVTDPPYGLSAQPDMREVLKHWLAGDDYEHNSSGFMGKSWDSFVPGPKIWEEVMRVLKPGGHILSFSGTRTYDLMVTAMRLAGSEIRDQIDVHCELQDCRDWTYGSGFPKSLNVAKQLGEDTEQGKKFAGYGTALKPAHEPIADFAKGDAKPLNGASLFYTAKTASKERNAGCGFLFWKVVDDAHVRITKEEHDALAAENEARKAEEGFVQHRLADGNPHPTVKPIQLARYLVKMVKMPGDNLILDPFCGSGSILCGCVLEGCNFVGIDMDPMSVELSKARTVHWKINGKR